MSYFISMNFARSHSFEQYDDPNQDLRDSGMFSSIRTDKNPNRSTSGFGGKGKQPWTQYKPGVWVPTNEMDAYNQDRSPYSAQSKYEGLMNNSSPFNYDTFGISKWREDQYKKGAYHNDDDIINKTESWLGNSKYSL